MFLSQCLVFIHLILIKGYFLSHTALPCTRFHFVNLPPPLTLFYPHFHQAFHTIYHLGNDFTFPQVADMRLTDCKLYWFLRGQFLSQLTRSKNIAVVGKYKMLRFYTT